MTLIGMFFPPVVVDDGELQKSGEDEGGAHAHPDIKSLRKEAVRK